MIDYPFTADEANAAYDEWGCNCGPSSLAFALQIGLDKVRGKIPGFEEKRYTSPSMMKCALEFLGVGWRDASAEHLGESDIENGRLNMDRMFNEKIALIRVQWTGPWTKEGANPKWAYRQTHWIATWFQSSHLSDIESKKRVFDCNGGIRSFRDWEKEVVPSILVNYPRADGGWYPTHVWRIER